MLIIGVAGLYIYTLTWPHAEFLRTAGEAVRLIREKSVFLPFLLSILGLLCQHKLQICQVYRRINKCKVCPMLRQGRETFINIIVVHLNIKHFGKARKTFIACRSMKALFLTQ